LSYFRTQLEQWLATLDIKADKVLDCGGGALPVKNRVKSFCVKEYKILDNELEDMKQKPDLKFDLNDSFTNLDKNGIHHFRNAFDLIFCLEVAEYLYRPFQALEHINYLMKKDGVLYISFPFIYPLHNPEGKDMLRYTRWGVEKLLTEAGFKIDYIKSRVENEPEMLGAFYAKEGMHPCKRYSKHNEIGYLVRAIKK